MDKKFEIAGNVSIVPTGKTTVKKEEFETVVDKAVSVDAGAGATLTEMYDRFSKLLYVIDSSGSMGDGMLSDESVKMYKWTPELLEQFRAAMEKDKYFEKQFAASQAEEDFDDEFEEEDEEDSSPVDVRLISDDQLKMEIVLNNLNRRYNIDLEMDYRARPKSRSKMMALKDAAKSFVHTRFMRFADARVAVFKFEEHPALLCADGASEEEVMNAIDRLPNFGGGGTDIYKAVERAVNECKRRPSEVGLHHIVLVSDGMDRGGMAVASLLPKMKELGIVFDFIYMVGATSIGYDCSSDEVAKVLKDVCEATGGEYSVVKTEQDFEQKFLAVSNRPMLPAPKK